MRVADVGLCLMVMVCVVSVVPVLRVIVWFSDDLIVLVI